jgi:benzoate membrane transport protein
LRAFTTGLLSALLACTGGAILLVKAAAIAGWPDDALLTCFFSVYVIGGVLNTLLTLRYKIPFAGAHSITGIAFVGSIAGHYSLPVLAGGFILSGLLMVVVGFTGIFGQALKLVPTPIINALLAGLLFSYVWGMIPASFQLPICGLMATVGYWVIPRFTKWLSPVIWSLVMAVIGLLIQNKLPLYEAVGKAFKLPMPVVPDFTVAGLISIAIPLSLLIMSNDLAVALASLRSHQYDPSVNRTITASGLACMCAGLFGGHAANVGGMMTALCSSPEAGDHSNRIRAALISNGMVILFGIFAWQMIGWIHILPAPFITIMTGIPLLGLFLQAGRSVIRRRSDLLPSIFTFMIAVMHINLFGLSAPLWALFAGAAISHLTVRIKKRANP